MARRSASPARRRRPRRSDGPASAPDVDPIECVIEGLAAGGDGVARMPDGRTLFVPLAAPGDRLRVEVTELRRRHARARILELLEPGPDRVTPRCDVFGECGGCTWQHLDYAAQLRAKAVILGDALERIGRLRRPDPLTIHPSPAAYGYRLRARPILEAGRVGYRRRRSRELCAAETCPVLEPGLATAWTRLEREAADGVEGEREILLGSDGRLQIHDPSSRSPRRGEPAWLEVDGRRLRVSPGVFAQANRGLLSTLVRSVRTAVIAGEAVRDGLLLELHAGAGLLTLACAPHFLRVVAVEIDERAARDLAFNLEETGITHAEVRAEDSATASAHLAGNDDRPDVVLLDPPRTGLEPGVVPALASLAAPRVVYLSCDPATLARDIALLCDEGYALTSVEGFDLFPQTPHVEALAVLERPAGGTLPREPGGRSRDAIAI